jgi:hypothetical protein
LLACDAPSAPEARGAGRGVRGPTDLPAPAAAPAPSPTRSRREPRRAAPAPSVGRAEPAVAAPLASPEAPSASDLSAALARAFGTPTDCISAATRERLTTGDGARRLSMQVQVVVTGSGRVTRASVSGSQLAEDDLECLRRRAEAVRIDAPIPDAPRSITTSIEYDVRSARVTPSGPDPIVGVPRGPGQVAPSSTLPGAQTETERPRGFIPPSSTLPALAE